MVTPPTRDQAPQEAPSGTVVSLDVIDPSGDPVEGVAVSLNGAEGTTDRQGQLTLRGVQAGIAVTEVSPPWLIRSRSTSHPVYGAAQRRLLIVERACPGALQLREEDGTPVEGGRVFRWHTAQISTAGSAVPLISDSTGEVYLPQRPCGAVQISVRLPDGETLPDLSVFVDADAPATLVIPATRRGTLLVVDAHGALLPTEAHAPPSVTIEPDGIGRFHLSARRAMQPLTVSPEGYPEQLVRVPLTGGVFEYTVDIPRAVDVTVRCDGDCPEALTCAMAPCEALGADRHRCRCPDEEALLAAYGEPIGTVYPEEDAVEVDLRASATLRGQWIGDLPCEVFVRYERGSITSEPCGADGGFQVEGLRPGWVTVSIQGRAEQAAHSLELLAGDTLDMGQLWPDSVTASGYIDADFPMQGARLESFPHGAVVLEPEGTFQIAGLPRQTRSVTLHLESPVYGSFRSSFVFTAGEEIVWPLSWRPEESLLGDSGDPVFDSGDPSWDTGWSEIGDSGWDSGL